MPKRADRASTSSKTRSKASATTSSKVTAKTASSDEVRGGEVGVEERGAFAIARCDRCGWQGSARRSRDRARKDLRQHLEDKPKHADHMSLEDVPR